MQRRRDRQRDDAAETRCDGERQSRAKRRADQGGEQRDQHDLGAVDREDAAAGGAERLHRADDVALARQDGGDRIGDADAADQKRGQADQREELAEALDVAFELRRSLVARADFPAGVGNGVCACLSIAATARSLVRCRQPQPVLPAHQAARLDEPAGAQARPRSPARAAQSRYRPRAYPARSISAARSSIVALPMVMRSPGFRSSRVSRAGSAAAPNAPPFAANSAGSGNVGVGHHRAEQRIGAIDRLQFDQRRSGRSAVRAMARSVAAADTLPCVSRKARSASLACRWMSENARSPPRMICPALPMPSVRFAATEPTPADRHDAERNAGNENGEAAHAAAQIAPRETQRREAARPWCTRRSEHQAALGAKTGLGAKRASRKCTGANASSGKPTINPANQT